VQKARCAAKGAPATGPTRLGVFYQWYELNHAAVAPWRAVADATRLAFQNPLNPLSDTLMGRSIAASAELFERTTRRYGKPEFAIVDTEVDGRPVAVEERVAWERPFCSLVHFARDLPPGRAADPKLLLVAPLSGHYATLLRGTVETMLPDHDVFLTDWHDARMVPLAKGRFDLDDYIDYIREMLRNLGPDTHVMAVCQPSVPVLAAVALMAEDDEPCAPRSMILMGGPIDTRINPTAVNRMAEEKGTDWFRHKVIMRVPFPHPGIMREVYPGFLQLSGFMSLNLDRHLTAHRDLFLHLVDDDGDSAEKHREFYDEYLAVMDLTAEFYLQTVDSVFVRHALPKGEMAHRGRPVRPQAIRSTALLTVEGERDDISGVGQTRAAHDLCPNIPAAMKRHHLQPRVGHYGVFNGSRFRAEVAPRITAFIRAHAARETRPVDESHLAIREPAQKDKKEELAEAVGLSAINVDGVAAVEEELTQIAGIGPRIAQMLNEAGIFQIGQLAELSAEAIRAVDEQLAEHGRAVREEWVREARRIADGAPRQA
jgi:poly(3-hydroxybutyrate) depolymerase